MFERFEFGAGEGGFQLNGFEVIDPVVDQAGICGIKPGWTVVRMNGRGVTAEQAQEILSSKEPFTVTFQVSPSLQIIISVLRRRD